MRLTIRSDTTFPKLHIIAALSLAHLAAACSWDDIDNVHQDPNDTAVGSVIIEPSELQLGGIGDSAFLTATAYDRANRPASDVSFNWSVSDAGVATIESSGLVKAVGLGWVTVTASTADVDGDAVVEVDSEYAA